MSGSLAKAALAFYPLAYRRRYGEEMDALVEEARPGIRGSLDLLRSALLAHLRPVRGVSSAIGPEDRLRLSASAILACWIVFAAAGIAFYKTTEGHQFAAAAGLGGFRFAVQALAVIASVALSIAALPLVLAALRGAATDRNLRSAAVLALGAVAVFVLASAALVEVANSAGAGSGGLAGAALAAWAVVGAACGGACWLAARRGIFALDLTRPRLSGVLVLGTAVTVAMALIVLAGAGYSALLFLDAPRLAGEANGPFGLLSVGLSLGLQLATMSVAATTAAISVRRGFLS